MKDCSYITHEKCTGCSACLNICAKNAIKMVEDKQGFLFPQIDNDLCVQCGLCYKVCPQNDSSKEKIIKKTQIKKTFYGYNTDENNRRRSSSGGVFNAIASYIDKTNGVIYGAAFDYSDNCLKHYSNKSVGIPQLQKSKYVQSEIGLIYRDVKSVLKQGKKVLFVGTPCQCAGLKKYLGEENSNLLICDFICHGVPSPKLLKDHIEYLGFKGRRISQIDFRPKIRSWMDYFIIKSQHKQYKVNWVFDPYYYFFEKGLSLRECCFNCTYSKGYRESDMTIADFWGYHRLDKNIYDKDGVSMVITYNDKATGVLEEIRQLRLCTLISMDEKYSDYSFKTTDKNIKARNAFFDLYVKNGYKRTARIMGFTPFKTLYKNAIQELKIKIKHLRND